MEKIKGSFQQLRVIPSKETAAERINEFTSTDVGREFEKSLRENSYQEGYKKGFQEGQLKKWQEISQKVELLSQCIANWKEIEKSWIKTVIPGAIRFSLEAVKKLTGEVIISGAVKLSHMIEPALSKIPDESEIEIRLHPSDFNQMEEIKHLIMKEIQGARLKFEKNESLTKGSIELNTCFGNFVTTPEIRMDAFLKEFLGKI